jgi:hypothetical protein
MPPLETITKMQHKQPTGTRNTQQGIIKTDSDWSENEEEKLEG